MSDTPVPNTGDILLIDFNPTLGSEQAGIRPAIVISTVGLHEGSKRAFVCPITGNSTEWPTKVPMPAGLKTKGFVLTDQIRAVDCSRRVMRKIEDAPPEFVEIVRGFVGRLMGLVLPAQYDK
jgi:mRNA interferase MazF